jgi:hypothetical protein
MMRFPVWPIIIIASAIGTGIAMFLNIRTPIRTAISFWFLLICPGMAYVRLLEIKEFFIELVLAIALSIALNTIVAEVLVLTNIWSPFRGLVVLIAICVAGSTLQIIKTIVSPKDTDQPVKKSMGIKPWMAHLRDRIEKLLRGFQQ